MRAGQAVLAALLVAYLIWTIPGVRPHPAFVVAFDAVLQGSCYLITAVLAVLAAVRVRPTRSWWLVCAAMCLRAVGFTLALTFRSVGHPLPFPSVADAAWVLSTLCLIGAVVLRIAERAPRLGVLVVLDGLALSLVALGVAFVVLARPIDTLRHEGVSRSEIITNIGYPVLDTVLLVAAAALVTLVRLRLRPAEVLLVAGCAAFTAVDYVYVVLLTEGRWHPGSLLSSFSLVATAALALSIVLAPARGFPTTRRVGQAPPRPTEPTVVVPAVIAVLALAGLVHAGVADATDLAFPIYGLAAAVAVLRGVLTIEGDRREAGVVIGTARSDLRQFFALVEASTDFIGIADVSANVVYLNPAGRRMLALGPDDDITAFTVGQLLGNQGATELDNRWPVLLERGSWQGESTIVATDGSAPIPVAISSFAVRDPATHEPVAVATVQRDIRERLRAEAAVRDLADQRAALLARLVQAQEDERARIAADVHDDPVQALAAVDLRLGVLRRRAAEQAPALVEAVDMVHSTVTTATERLRHLLFDLEPPAREAGLGNSLAEVGDFVFAGTPVRCEVTGDRDLALPEAELVTAYRIAKEALVNARKHAEARRVVVDVARTEDGVSVTVSDDGRGITASEERSERRRGHLGLPSMRDRAAAAGGTLSVGRREGGGTQVRLWLPLEVAS
jgi:signal transduction histidine kinase